MPRTTRRWNPARCLAAASLSLGLAAGLVGATAAAAAAQPRAAGFQGGPSYSGPFNWRGWHATVKGTVAATPAPTSSGFTLDVPGCNTPQAITTNGSTTYSEPGTGVTPAGVVAGEHVIVQLVWGASTLTAANVTILLAQISGTVDSATSTYLLVTDQQGFQRTIDLDVNGTTVYFPTGATVATGDLVNAFGTVDADHVALDAVAIHVQSPPTPPTTPPPSGNFVTGLVGSVTPGTSFVLEERDGTTETIATPTTTKYFEFGAPTPPTGVVSGEHVFVTLVPGASTPTARTVFIMLTQLNGTVVSVGSTSFVLQDSQGFWWTVDVGPGTTYSPSGTTLAGLTGDDVVASGTVDPDLTDLDAQFVYVLPTSATTWFNSRPWSGVPSGCPVSPPATRSLRPAGYLHGIGNSDPHGAGTSISAGIRSSSQRPGSTSSGTRGESATTTATSSGAEHGYSDPGSIGTGNGDPRSFPASPGAAGNGGAPAGRDGGTGGGGGAGRGARSGGPGGGGGSGGAGFGSH